jgi:hypothetical protein
MKRRKMKKILSRTCFIVSIIAVVSMSGCMSIGKAGDDEIAGILDLINNGSNEQLTSMSSNPFLLDGEILHGASLSGSFWKELANAGFSLSDPEITGNEFLNSSDSNIFGDTADVKAFFNNYIPDYSLIIEINAEEGQIFMILSPSDTGKRVITAWGGPY